MDSSRTLDRWQGFAVTVRFVSLRGTSICPGGANVNEFRWPYPHPNAGTPDVNDAEDGAGTVETGAGRGASATAAGTDMSPLAREIAMIKVRVCPA